MNDLELQQLLARQAQYQGQRQSAMPQGRMVGRTYVAPNFLENVAAGLRQYGGIKGEQQVTGEINQLRTKREGMDADAMVKFASALRGEPARDIQPATPMDDEGNMMPVARKEAVSPDVMAGYGALMGAYNPQMRQAGMQGMAQIPQMQEQRQFQRDQLAAQNQAKLEAAQMAQQAKAEQMALAHQQRMDVLAAQNASREQMAQAQREFQQQMQKQSQEFQQSMRQLGGSVQPYFQPVQTAQGVMAFNARTGRMETIAGADGKPVIGAQADPALQGAIAGSKKSATELAEGVSAARGEARKADMFLQQLTQAEDILKKGPTASGVGAVVDAAGRVVGASTPGAQRAGQLEALSGWLVANVPRMEGPQSNFDVQNYMTMAGKIGDRTVPVQERMAALNEVRRLQEKYKSSAEQRMGGAPSPTTPKRIKLDAQGNIIP